MKKKYIMIPMLLWAAQTTNAQKIKATLSGSASPGISQFAIEYDCRLLDQGYPEDVNILRPKDTGKSWGASKKEKATSVFIEYGDGTFGFNSKGGHSYNMPVLSYPLLTKSSGLYDDDKRPPRHTLSRVEGGAIAVAGSGITPSVTEHARGVMFPPVLAGDSVHVKITPSINSVIASDTMVYVLTYRLSYTKGDPVPYIRFSYNNTAVFHLITDPAAPLPFEDLSVPQVRMYYDEKADTVSNPKTGFSNGLYFRNLALDNEEHSIFITLVPDSLLAKNENMPGLVKVEADIMINDRMSETASSQLEGGMLSHDPNYITISPACNLLPKTGKILTFKVHCQNEGLGYAKMVVIKIGLPRGINSKNIRKYNHMGAKVPYHREASWNFDDRDSLTVTLRLADDTHPLHALRGIYKNPGWQNDPATMAEAWFSIPVKVNMPDIISAAANIYFYNYDDSKNPAVTTNTATAVFTNCCGRNCKPVKNKKLWRWLFFRKCA